VILGLLKFSEGALWAPSDFVSILNPNTPIFMQKNCSKLSQQIMYSENIFGSLALLKIVAYGGSQIYL